MSSSEPIEYLYGLERYGIVLGLERILYVLNSMGNPHHDIKAVHIAGTNGKGSTAAFIASVLTEAGYKVGLYTSPHLEEFPERIRIDGKNIPWTELCSGIELIKEKIPQEGFLTFFEFTTILAFWYFHAHDVDIAVIETGMGGRLDATNVIVPLISIITNIFLDHEEFLGDSLEHIAREKGGIIKKGIPLVSGAKQLEIRQIFEKMCEQKNSPIYRWDLDYKIFEKGRTFDFIGPNIEIEDITLSLEGRYQRENASSAIMALELLKEKGFSVEERHIVEGLKNTHWPGRMEIVLRSPLLIMDGAHNPDGAEALVLALKDFSYRRLFLILGIMKDKNWRSILGKFQGLAHELIVSSPSMERAVPSQMLYDEARKMFRKVSRFDRLYEAIQYALDIAQEDDLICITGSLFTVGEARKILKELRLLCQS